MRDLVRDLFREPRGGAAILVSVGAPLAALVCWYFGTDVRHAIAIGACLGAVGVVWVAWPDHRPLPWREHQEQHEGARWDVVRLSWSLRAYRGGRVGLDALRRVQALGRHRLALRQRDPSEPSDTPAIESLIGSGALAVLRSSGMRMPTPRSLVRCLDALDALEVPEPTRLGGRRRVAALSRLRVMLRRWHPVLTSPRRRLRRAR